MFSSNLAWKLGIASVIILADVVFSTVPKQNPYYEKVAVIPEVLSEVDANYYRELSDKEKVKLVEDMIALGLEQLDPHSTYIPPHEWKEFNEQNEGEFEGIGIQIDGRSNGQLTVVSPVPGTPAYDAGILAGDIIVKINDTSTENMKLPDAIDRIKGKKGERITLTVRHEGEKEPVAIDIVRDKIKVLNVLGDRRQPGKEEDWDYYVDKKNKIGYVRLLQFIKPSYGELRDVIQQFENDHARGVILDLRGNPGGLLDAACDIANLFIDDGVIVTVKGRNHKEEVHKATPDMTLMKPAEKFPMVVLVDHDSASASEIVAAALQDHHRATIVGERSYGKGSVQSLIKLEGGQSRLKLTTAHYWRPSGKNIHREADSKDSDEWGVMPDIEVPLTRDQRNDYRAYRHDRDKVTGKDKTDAKPDPDLEKDKILKAAIEHLRQKIDK
jgi:carboxyl-terminal processing protease